MLVVFRVIQHALGALSDTTLSPSQIAMLSASNTCDLPRPFGEKISPTVFEAYLRPRLEELRKCCLMPLIPRAAHSDPNYFSKFL